MTDKPVTREEKYLAYLTGDYKGEIPKPITRKEKYLYELCLKGIGGEISPEEIKNAVNEYLEKNPVKPGATTEQAQQIEQNKKDVASLKEDISNKITKFYASNQGEAHITDSDNGKIQDMVLYGKSEQKQYKGINLLPPDTNVNEYVEVSIPKGSLVFWVTDGTPANGGNFRFFNEDKTESMWFGAEQNSTSRRESLTIDAKYVQNLINTDFDLSKMCLGVGSVPVYEPYTSGQPSPSPDYPQEIKSVVNPTIKLLGSNILKIMDGEYQQNGLTVTVSNGVVKLKGTPNRNLDISLTVNNKMFFKEGTKIIFSPNNVKGIENKNGSYLDFTNNNTIGFSITSNNLNIPYIIKEKDAKYGFALFIRCHVGITYDEIWKPQVLIGETIAPFKPYTEQTITLPITLNAIPVSSGGNVTIDGQQYIADYVDVERGKLVKMVDSSKLDNTQSIANKTEWLLAEPQETDLTTEEIATFKALTTYYPTTNISINSEQIDGYTIFNYPISMANGWNYVKQQLNDNRDYIYDMDLQSAEAYVNSEYAVALTELEV